MVSFSTFLLLVGAASSFGRVLKSSSLDDQGGLIPVRQRPVRQTSTCSAEYSEVEGSTMCITDSSDYIEGSAGITADDQELILKIHNDYRAGVSPTATKMPKLYWNDELAKLAEKWAKQCKAGHEEWYGKSRFIPAYGTKPGQNAARWYPDWTTALRKLYEEVSDFSHGQGSVNGRTVGHYTQIVNDKTVLVGCGFARCHKPAYRYVYVCNYLKGQSTSSLTEPYTTGSSCSGCTGKCTGKLCDCGDKFCFNRGTMDWNTCKCNCVGKFEGPTCEESTCK